MSWAISTVFCADTPTARAVFAADPRLGGHVFALDFATVELPPKVGAGFDGRLLALRSPIRARDVGLVGDGFDWAPLGGELAARLAGVRPGLSGPSSRIAPPDKALRWLEDLAAYLAAPVAWYMAEADTGAPEAEIAWVLDWRGPSTVDEEPLLRAPAAYTTKAHRNLRLDPQGATGAAREPLGAALLHLGLRLDGPWFTPHRPDFDWASRRVG